VAFGESVEGEGADGLDDFVLGVLRDVFFAHALTEFLGDAVHFFVGTFEGHGSAEFVGFGAIEVGEGHGHSENLFLEKRDAEGAVEDRFEGGVDVVDIVDALAAVEVGVEEVADDRTGADDGDFDGKVVEGPRLHDREGGHLGAGFDLEGADGVGAAEELEDGGVVLGDGGGIDGVAVFFAEGEGVFDGGEHAEAEEIDFDDAEVFAVVLVPLDDGAAGHAGGLEGDDVVESAVADDHAAGVLAEVAGEGEDGVVEVEEGGEAWVGGGDAGGGEGLLRGSEPWRSWGCGLGLVGRDGVARSA